MLQALVQGAGRLLNEVGRSVIRPETPAPSRTPAPVGPASTQSYRRIARVTLTDQVMRTLFGEYQTHRQGSRGSEETGWVLLGLRLEDEAVVLATLPAGARSKTGVAHVLFNGDAQALGSRLVRQTDRRLTTLGIVHTHPGTLRHPSDGDFRGDSEWVSCLRGREGVFGIGTADGKAGAQELYLLQPRKNEQCLQDLCFTWYVLAQGDAHYRPLPCRMTLGPDLAQPLHPVWAEIETHAEPLDRLYRQQIGVTFDVAAGQHGRALAVNVPLAQAGSAIRVLMEGKDVSYYVCRAGETLAANLNESRVDRGVYLVLAQLSSL